MKSFLTESTHRLVLLIFLITQITWLQLMEECKLETQLVIQWSKQCSFISQKEEGANDLVVADLLHMYVVRLILMVRK